MATKKSRCTEEQITFELRQVGMGPPVEEVACKFGVSEAGEAERRHRRSKDSASDRAQTIGDNFTRKSLAIVIRRGNTRAPWTLVQNGRGRVRDTASLSL